MASKMNKTLEDLFELPELDDGSLDIGDIHEIETCEDALNVAAEIFDSISNSEKIDKALTSVVDLNNHDKEMDEIGAKAMESFKDLMSLGMNVSDAHAGRIFEVASLMLETKLKTSDAKVNRKMKTIDLQLKKARLDHDINVASKKGDPTDEEGGSNDALFDRNELIRIIKGESDTKPPNI